MTFDDRIVIAIFSAILALAVSYAMSLVSNWRHDQEQRRQHRAALSLLAVELRERLALLGAYSEYDTLMRIMNADSDGAGTDLPFANDLSSHRRVYESASSTVGQLPVDLSVPIAMHYESAVRMHRDFHERFFWNGNRDSALELLREYIAAGELVLSNMDEAESHFSEQSFRRWLCPSFWNWLCPSPTKGSTT